MATTISIAQDTTKQVDLGNSVGMNISAPGGQASVYVDYKPAGSTNYTSAIKGSAGYGDPFTVAAGGSKAVPKTDLESEIVRVGAKNAGITVTY